jgi:hypothetical protein
MTLVVNNANVEVKGAVQVGVNINGLSVEQAKTPAGKTALTNSIADAAKVQPSQVSITSITAVSNRRMRMLSAQINVVFTIVLADLAQANLLETSIRTNTTALAVAMVSSLRAANPTNFAAVVIGVTQTSSGVTVVAVQPAAKSRGLSVGAIVGNVIGVVGTIVLLAVTIVIAKPCGKLKKPKRKTGTVVPHDSIALVRA